MDKTKVSMDKRSLDYLLDYVETSHFSPELFNLIEGYGEYQDVLFRGILYPKECIKVGHVYEHDYEITSWSHNKEVAIDFALNKSISERALTKRHYDLSGENLEEWELSKERKQELTETFCPIVLVQRSGMGLSVNKYCEEHEYQQEEEVIVYQGKWCISAFREIVWNENSYFEIEVERGDI